MMEFRAMELSTGVEPGALWFQRCRVCARLTGEAVCTAFPKGIPREIIAGEADHMEPFPGDLGLRFVSSLG
jgi:hypothetical protein